MAKDQKRSASDDWLKVLSLLALMSKDVPDRGGSAVVVAFIIVALSIYSRTVFYLLHFGATAFLAWAAIESWQADLAGYALLYAGLGIVLVAEGERLREGKGQFLSAAWWAGQFALHIVDIRSAYASGGASGFFTDLFCVISGFMMVKELARGIRLLWTRPKVVLAEVVDESPPEKQKAA